MGLLSVRSPVLILAINLDAFRPINISGILIPALQAKNANSPSFLSSVIDPAAFMILIVLGRRGPATAKQVRLAVLMHNKRTFFCYSGRTSELQAIGIRKSISRE